MNTEEKGKESLGNSIDCNKPPPNNPKKKKENDLFRSA